MLKAIIYDLDHTLFDPHTIDKGIFNFVFKFLKENQKVAQEDIEHDFFTISLNAFIEKHVETSIHEAFVEILRTIPPLGKLNLYESEVPVCKDGITNYLVTSGLREYQNNKIDSLGIRNWFAEIFIDDPFESMWTDKQEIFEYIIQSYNYKPKELLIVGDNPNSEIAAGNRLGITTIQILRKGIQAAKNADFHMKSVGEVNEYILEHSV
ncbi:HAD family hydrolase [Paracrocinitomix mangrovi]|uniref:HAD family hydrolase n=1 Tax=Paracrocinitomix mangrovi TaxID=2862509 RepID=UPI001C8D6DDD|nr:HAD family hydrolase [Paracrocinitomix mangrovi]UKN00228.1 HAD family hydrolase [Paracrocinitomix mangrovi]